MPRNLFFWRIDRSLFGFFFQWIEQQHIPSRWCCNRARKRPLPIIFFFYFSLQFITRYFAIFFCCLIRSISFWIDIGIAKMPTTLSFSAQMMTNEVNLTAMNAIWINRVFFSLFVSSAWDLLATVLWSLIENLSISRWFSFSPSVSFKMMLSSLITRISHIVYISGGFFIFSFISLSCSSS